MNPNRCLRTPLSWLPLLSMLLAPLAQADLPPMPRLGDSEIWAGKPVESGDHDETFYLSLTRTEDGVIADQICTGVLVHPRLILTAAHCLKGSKLRRVGNGTDAQRKKFYGTVVDVERSKYHPQYHQGPSRHLGEMAKNARFDIAFLVLRTPVTTIDLPRLEILDPVQAYGRKYKTIGYGLTRYVTEITSSRDFGKKRFGTNVGAQAIDHILYMDLKKGGALPGDSGGPVFLDEAGPRTLVGLLHSMVVRSDGQYEGFTAHLFSAESLCWVKAESGIDVFPSLTCPEPVKEARP